MDRARARTTVLHQVRPDLSVGLEFNPAADDLGLLVNWRALEETASRPALILGTSSDRIGTPDGRAYFGTLSKDLERLTGLPIAPYAGASYGEADDEFVGLGGLFVRWCERWNSTHLYDGHNVHHVLAHGFDDGPVLGLVLAEQSGDFFLGLTMTSSFAAGPGN